MSNWIPPKSPYNLIQEHFWEDPWKLFVACIFCNLTKRVEAEPYMWKFFERYPDPSSAAQANPDDIALMIQPLGLSQRRSRALVKMSGGYIRGGWERQPELLYVIGKYGKASYDIFILGRWKEIDRPNDHALAWYWDWLWKNYE